MYKLFASEINDTESIPGVSCKFLLQQDITLLRAIMFIDEYKHHGITGVERKYAGEITAQSVFYPLSAIKNYFKLNYIIEKDNKIDAIAKSVGRQKIPGIEIGAMHLKNLKEMIYDFKEFWTDI